MGDGFVGIPLGSPASPAACRLLPPPSPRTLSDPGTFPATGTFLSLLAFRQSVRPSRRPGITYPGQLSAFHRWTFTRWRVHRLASPEQGLFHPLFHAGLARRA